MALRAPRTRREFLAASVGLGAYALLPRAALAAVEPRTVAQVWSAEPRVDGAGVHLRRAFSGKQAARTDPFLLLDILRSDRPQDYLPGFPWHPHRGMETLTLVLDGQVEHADSLGNGGTIRPGDAQWMTAGRGVLHQEMPRGNTRGTLFGLQLWLNLPAKQKMTSPVYRPLSGSALPTVTGPHGSKVRLLAGTYRGASGPVTHVSIRPHVFDVTLPQGAVFEHTLSPEATALAYVIEGSADFGAPTASGEGDLVVYNPGPRVVVATDGGPARFVFLAGTPLREPIAWGGPIVMNTAAEVEAAFRELKDGTFIHG